MDAALLEAVRAPVSVATTRCHSGGVGHQMNMFKQVSSDHHQMSLEVVGPQVCCLGGTLSCDLSHNAFGVTW